jgi:hypothetical protein
MRTLGALVLCAALLVACGGGASEPGAQPGDPDSPVSDTPDPNAPSEPNTGPSFVTPQPGQADVRAINWDRAKVLGPRQVRVRFWSGIEPCYVLDRVKVDYREDEVAISLFEGHTPPQDQDEDVACIEIAVLKATDVKLDEPLAGRAIMDGNQSQ